MAISAEQWNLQPFTGNGDVSKHISEKFSSGMKNAKQTFISHTNNSCTGDKNSDK